MTDERIKAAAKWLKSDAEFGCRYAPDSQLLDAAQILSLLAEGKAVLCKAEPAAWKYKGEPWFDGTKWHQKFAITDDVRLAQWKDKSPTPLHAPLDPWKEEGGND